MSDPHALRPHSRREQPRPWIVAGAYLAAAGLAFFHVIETIPAFQDFVRSPAFPIFHEPADVVAVIVALLAAHSIQPRTGRKVILLFLVVSLAGALARLPQGLSELPRLLVSGGAGLLGVHLIAARKQVEARLSELVLTDPLTAVANSRRFHEELARQLGEHRRHGTCGAVLFLDLDGFKRINDRFGHGVGDQILRGVAMRLAREIRATDIVARMGGDEFAVLLPHTAQEQARTVADRLLAVVESINPRLDDPSARLSASFGMALYPENGATAERLITAADQAMYQAKEGGRGQIVASDVPAPKEEP